MERICPLCNELHNVIVVCDKCGSIMTDKGRPQEYQDAYGPQEPIHDANLYCQHIFECEKCREIKKMNIIKVVS